MGLTKEIAQAVLDTTVAALHDQRVKDGSLKRSDGFFVVADPAKLWEPKYDKEGSEGLFAEEVVLAQVAFGDPDQWEHPYDMVARSKLFISWKTSLPSDALHNEPWLYEPGMTMYGGSFVYRPPGASSSLITAYSGGSEPQDKGFAAKGNEAIRDRMRLEFVDARDLSPDAWVGGRPAASRLHD